MELSTELISEIAGVRMVAPARHSADEKRKHERVALAARATISSLSRGLDGMEEVVIVRDISVASIGLLCPEAMEIGHEFVIQFSGEHGLAARILCKVSRCEPGGFGGSQFIVGGSFEIVIHPAQPSAGVAKPAVAQEAQAAWTADPSAEEKPADAVANQGAVRNGTGWLQSWRKWLPTGQNDDLTRTA